MKNLREIANKYIQKNSMTKEEFAKEIGVSRSLVSKYLNNKYESDATNIENAIADYLETKGEKVEKEIIEQNKTKCERPEFFSTSDSKSIIGICKSCQDFKSLGIIVGKSGYGKTYALKQYAKIPRVAYVECDDAMSCKDFIEALERSVGIPNASGTIWKRVGGIKDFFLINKGYLLVVDEADKLINKDTQKKLEILRAIFDQSKVGIVIAGEPNLEIQIKKYLTRFANRIDFYINLKGLSKEEVRKYLEGLNFSDEAIEEMVSRATNYKTGCFRLFDRTLKNIYRLVNIGDEVTLDNIRKASGMMML